MAGYLISRELSPLAFDMQATIGGKDIIEQLIADSTTTVKECKIVFPIYIEFMDTLSQIEAPESAIEMMRLMAYKRYTSSHLKYDKSRIIIKLKGNKTASFNFETASIEEARLLLVFMQRHGYMKSKVVSNTRTVKASTAKPKKKESLIAYLSTEDGREDLLDSYISIFGDEPSSIARVIYQIVIRITSNAKSRRYIDATNPEDSNLTELVKLVEDV